nr:ARM repeat superfamily protein [Ipomoea batatas]
MPPLLQSAQLKPDVSITSADSDNEIDESDDDSMETITLGDKRIGIKTSVLEEKATTCNMLCCYADELKEGFYPWIDQLLHSAKLAIEKGLAQGRNEAYVKQLSDYVVPALVEALHKEPDTEICANMLDSLNECLQTSPGVLDEAQARSIVDEIKQVITASSKESELLKEENEQEEEVFDQIHEADISRLSFAVEFAEEFYGRGKMLHLNLGDNSTAFCLTQVVLINLVCYFFPVDN